MIHNSKPGSTPTRPHKATLLGRAIAGVGSMLEVLREAQAMRADAQRRYPFVET
ncbi:hypothetical protein [Rhodoplanes elegans]|uniref:hypothetical protein n=1 Tax=Rhodoplanes elegans TaxID=29408 RepID=UPI00147285AB|nr:hypothetical protein [Rhodoplanes elegans]